MSNPLTGYLPGSTYWNSQAYANPPAVTTAPRDLSRTAAWANTFGQPQGDAVTRRTPDEGVNRGVWIFPEAKRGQSRELSATMLLVMRSLNDAILNTWLPMSTPTDGALQSHWSRWEFPTQMPDVVPHRGVVRLLKSNRIQGTTSMVRRGIGMFMEHDFMRTPLGKKHYLMHLKQINQSVAEGLQFQGIYAMLNADNWGRKYLMDNGDLAVNTRMERIMEREFDRWAILQQNPNAWAFLDNIITKENDMYNPGTKLTHYLLDSAVSMYVTTIPTEQWQYYMRGPAGPEMIRQGVEGFAVDSRGNRITETRAFLADEEGAITPLAQKTQIGEVFIAYDLYMDEGSYEGYTSGDRDVEYYDETFDNMARLKVREMLDNCHRFDENGELYDFGDRRAIRFNLSRFSEQQKDLDFLHYKNARGERVKVRYFGQIDPYHMTEEDYRDAGRSAINALASNPTSAIDQSEMGKAFRDLRSLFQTAATYNNVTELQRWIAAINAGGVGSESIRHPLLGEIMVAATNQYGSINIPARGIAANLTSMGYPVTHMTWGGLQTVATSPNAVGWFGQKAVDVAQKAVEMMNRLVPRLQMFYPGSIFLDPTYAPAAIKNASAADAFFNSVLMAGIVTTSSLAPFNRAGLAGGNAGEGSTVIKQLEDLAIGGVSGYADAIGGTTTNADVAAAGRAAGGVVLIAANPNVALTNDAGGNALRYVQPAQQRGINLATGRQVQGTLSQIATAAVAVAPAAYRGGGGRAGQVPYLGGAAGRANANDTLLTNYTNFIRFTQMVRTTVDDVDAATDEAGLTRLVAGLLGRALILNIVAFIKTTNAANTTLARFNDIFAAIRDTVPGLNGAYDDDAHYTWIRAGTAFQDSATLERMVRAVMNLINAHPDWVSDEIGSPNMLQNMLEGIVASFNRKKAAVRDSLSRAPTNARGGAAGAAQNLALYQQALTERHAGYVATPLTWTNTTLKSFVEGVIAGTVAMNALFLVPASVEDPRVPMNMSEFRELSIQAANALPERTLAAGAADAGAGGLIGAGLDSIHISNIHTNQIAASIVHNNATRAATIGSRAQDHDSEPSALRLTGEGDDTARMLGETASEQIGAAIGGSGAYQAGFSRTRMAGRAAEDRQDTSSYLAGGSRRKRRTLLQDSAYGDEQQTFDDVRDARKRARFANHLQQQGFSRVNLLSEKITPSMRVLYSKLMLRGVDDLVSIFGILFLGTPVTKQALESTIENNLMHPFNYVCARPHARYTGLTIIKGAPEGGKIGTTLLLFPKVEVADDGTTGVQHTNFTYYSDSVVVNSKMLNITHNAMIDYYHGGLGSGFYERETYDPSNDEYGEGSFFIFAIPRRERPEGRYISISGTYDWADGQGNVMRDGSADSMTYSTAPFYCGFWGFHQTGYNRPMDLTTSNQKYTMEYCAPNNICCKSTAIYFRNKRPVAYTTQTGHWQQQSVGPGLAKARIGKKPMDNTAYRSVIANLRQITQ